MRTKNIFIALALMVAAVLLSVPMASAQNLTPKVHPKSGLYGYWGTKKNGKGAFIIKPKFDRAERFVNGHAFVSVNGAWYVIGNDGMALLSTTYSKASALSNDHYCVRQGDKYGVVDLHSLAEILPVKYDAINTFDDKYKLTINGKHGLADKSGTEILPVKYDAINILDGKYELTIDGKHGLADKSGAEILPIMYDAISAFDGKYKLKINGKLGLVDKSGSEILPIKYNAIDTFDGKYKLTIDGKLGLVDKSGSEILPIMYDAISAFDGKYKLKINGKLGLVDKSGSEILPVKYDKIDTYDGKYKLTIDGKLGLADKSGMEILPVMYDAIWICDDKYELTIDGKHGLADQSGTEILPVRYDAISVLDTNAYKVAIGDKWGIVDKTNKVIVEPQYKAVESVDGGLYALFSDKWIFVDSLGKVVDISDRVMHYATNDGQEIAEHPADQNLFCDGVGVLVYTNVIEPEQWINFLVVFDNVNRINGKDVISDGGFKILGDKLVWVDKGASSVSIPATVKSIAPSAFMGCENIRNVNVADLNVWLRSGVDMSECNWWQLYHNGEKITNVTIPNGVTEIADGQFCGNESLTSITIPASVKEIGKNAFCGCSSLTSITIPENVTYIGEDAFMRDQEWGTFYIYMKSATPPALGRRFENWYYDSWGCRYTTYDVDVIIYVPQNALFAYNTTEGWEDMADKIYPMD